MVQRFSCARCGRTMNPSTKEGPNPSIERQSTAAPVACRSCHTLESNGNFEGERNATHSLDDDCHTWTAAYGLCGHRHLPNNGSSTGFGSDREASRWAPARQSPQCDTGPRVG